MTIRGKHETMQGIASRTETGMQDAARITGCGDCQLGSTLNERDAGATLSECMGSGTSCDTATDDDGGAGIHPLSLQVGWNRNSSARHLTLVSKALCLLHFESHLLQSTSYPASTGVRCQGGTLTRGTRHVHQHVLTPHLMILGRRKTIEEPCIHAMRWQLWQRLVNIRTYQGKPHSPPGETPTVPTWHTTMPTR